MSSAGIAATGAAPAMLYFCHRCEHSVNITPSPSDEPICPTCNSGFVEELENPNPNPFPDPFLSAADPFGMLSNFFMPAPSRASSSFQSDPQNPIFPHESEPFDPISYLFSHLAARRASGVNFQFVVDDNPSGAGFHLPSNLGDYFVGPGFEQLIQQLAENDPNRYGTPPASRSAVEGLPNLIVDEALMKSELAQCAVCKDDFELGVEVKQMPCKHVYHKECILPWLELHNSCPVCRYELPTDDPDYDGRARGNSGSSGVNSESGGSGGSQGRRVERRFTISLPWPLGGSGSSSSGGQSESRGQGNPDPN